jgi:electron transfer flavoprotein-quinone oxidoreductase
VDKAECIVVGAGPSGSACALSLARKGVETVLLERGQQAGEKNVASFILFGEILSTLIPGFENEAPLERRINDVSFIALTKDAFIDTRMALTGHYEKQQIHTAYRTKLDGWFAGKAEEAGATLLRGVCVTGLLKENGRVVGVKVGDEEMLADVVIGADGFHSVVARDSGLLIDDTSRFMLGVREVLDLPAEVIEDRFQIGPDGGCMKDGWGYPVADVGGLMAIYTMRDSVTLTLFAPMDAMKEGLNLRERMEQFKEHPYVARFIKDAKLREYEAHILADGARIKMDKLYTDAVLLCGEAGGFNSNSWVGVPSGMLSGIKAAEAVALARRKGRYDAETLSCYRDILYTTGLPRMLYFAKSMSDFMARRGKPHMQSFTENLVDYLTEAVMEEVNFTDPEPFSYIGKGYDTIMAGYIRKNWLKLPLKLTVKAVDRLFNTYMKWKIRRTV